MRVHLQYGREGLDVEVKVSGRTMHQKYLVHVEGNDAFVVNGEGLFRVDVSEPAAPVPAGYAPIGGSSRAVSATDGAVWVAALDGGLVQLDRR